jgi:hypothetical protein
MLCVLKSLASFAAIRLPTNTPALQCCVTSSAWWQSSWLVVRLPTNTPALQCVDAIYSVNLLEERTPDMSAVGHTLARASSEQSWELIASSSVDFCRKTRTVQVRRNPMMLTLTRRNPWRKTRTVPRFRRTPQLIHRVPLRQVGWCWERGVASDVGWEGESARGGGAGAGAGEGGDGGGGWSEEECVGGVRCILCRLGHCGDPCCSQPLIIVRTIISSCWGSSNATYIRGRVSVRTALPWTCPHLWVWVRVG